MAFISADGLFNGERFERVSDSARYAWPYLWVASNTCGRIELNYHRVVGRAFSRFHHVPTEEEFWGWIREFQNAYLLFVYEVDGAYWGQWDTSEKFLQRHKLAADLASPKPDHDAWNTWREEYIHVKQAKNSSKPIVVTNFKNASEIVPKHFGKSSETFRGNVRGEDRSGEEWSGLNTCSPDGERDGTPDHKKPPTPNGKVDAGEGTAPWGKPERSRFFQESFWAAWPRKVAKAEAERAFHKRATSPEIAAAIVKAAKDQTPMLVADGLKFCPHAATWLNAKRYTDDPNEASAAQSVVPTKPAPEEWRPSWEADRV